MVTPCDKAEVGWTLCSKSSKFYFGAQNCCWYRMCAVLALGCRGWIQGTAFSSLWFYLVSVVSKTGISLRWGGFYPHKKRWFCALQYPYPISNRARWPWVAALGTAPQHWPVCVTQQFLAWFDCLPHILAAGCWEPLHGDQLHVQGCLRWPAFFYLVCRLCTCCCWMQQKRILLCQGRFFKI